MRAWSARLGGRAEFSPYQESAGRFETPEEDFAASVHLFLPDGRALRGAEAVFSIMALAPGRGWALRLYRGLPGFAAAAEAGYRFVAGHRRFFSRLTRLLWGGVEGDPGHVLARRAVLASLGIVYAAAFLSLHAQAGGLIGDVGVLPLKDFLKAVSERFGPAGYWMVPTVFWFDAGEGFVRAVCLGGALLSVFVLADVLSGPALLLQWAAYLSLSAAAQDFLGFQWDVLLAEAGFLAIFWGRWGVKRLEAPSSAVVLWLFRWLVFRLMFTSGLVKWASGDLTWRNLTALTFHYQTQPLPTVLAWHLHHLPEWVHRACGGLVFVVEGLVPFLVFAPRRARFLAAGIFLAFQAAIALTGNYGFFNLLTAGLCLSLLDDAALARLLRRPAPPPAPAPEPSRRRRILRRAALAGAAALVALGGLQTAARLVHVPDPARQLLAWIGPYRIANPYGLFAVMTTVRPEIVIEGSDDGEVWKEYAFKWKPGDPARTPGWAAPHQPRLDWQMWFAALGRYENHPWFLNLMVRLLQGSPPVLALLDENPFPGGAPRYVRALIYVYAFTTPAERAAGAGWWKRELKGRYCPPVALAPK